MSVHPSIRGISIGLDPSGTANRDQSYIIFADDSVPTSSALPNGQTLATGQRAICLYSGATSTESALYVTFDGGTSWSKLLTLSDLLLPATSDITIAAGAATLAAAVHTIRGAGGLADDLDTISGMDDSEVAFLICGAEAITIRDAAVGGGNIATSGDASLVLATGDAVMAVRSGSVVRVTPLSIAAGIPEGSLADIPDAGSLYTATTLAAMLQEVRTTLLTLAVADATVTAGAVAPVQTRSTIRGEGAVADDCDTITIADDQTVELVTGAEAITYRDASVGGGNISTRGNASIVTATGDVMRATRSGAVVYVEPVMVQAGVPSEATTATNQAERRVGTVHYDAPIAEEYVSIVADVAAANGAQIIAGQPDYPRALAINITIAVNPITDGDVTVVGVGKDGEAVTEVIDITTAVSTVFYTAAALATVTSVTVSDLAGAGGAGDNIGVGVASKLGLPATQVPAASGYVLYKTVVSGADEAVAGLDATNGTVDPTSAPNGARNYDFLYTYSVTPLQNSHTHAV